jgi:hypothetical protein
MGNTLLLPGRIGAVQRVISLTNLTVHPGIPVSARRDAVFADRALTLSSAAPPDHAASPGAAACAGAIRGSSGGMSMAQSGKSRDLGATLPFDPAMPLDPLPERLPWPLAALVILLLSGLLWGGIGAVVLQLVD